MEREMLDACVAQLVRAVDRTGNRKTRARIPAQLQAFLFHKISS